MDKNKSSRASESLFWSVYTLSLFFASFTYAALLTLSSSRIDHLVTIGYVLSLAFAFYVAYLRIQADRNSTSRRALVGVVCAGIAVNLGILAGFQAMSAPLNTLWVVDSMDMHVPGSKNIADVLSGVSELRVRHHVFDRIYFTHLVVGTLFYLFGVSPFVSGLGLALGKLASMLIVYWLGVAMFDRQRALVAALIFALVPTITFYTVTFYKEAFVQCFVGLATVSLYEIAIRKRYWMLLVFAVAALVLANERFYLFPIFIGTLFLFFVISKHVAVWIRLVASATAIALGTWFHFHHIHDENVYRLVFDLGYFRQVYNSYPDVDPINLQLPYPLAVLKFLFTPFFTLRKFDIFYDFSLLLTWGSFLNQIVIFCCCWSMGYFLFRRFSEKWIVILPFLSFVAVFGYIAPYSGRLRDSFYVLIAVFAADGVTRVKSRFSWILERRRQ